MDSIQEIISAARGLLALSDMTILKETVDRMIDKFRNHSNDDDSSDSIRDFYLQLARESVQLNNIKLAFIAIEKLDVKQMLTIVEKTIDGSSHDRYLAMRFLESQMGFVPDKMEVTSWLPSEADIADSLNVSHNLCRRLLNHHQQDLDNKSLPNDHLRSILYNGMASCLELDENFNSSLTYYEKSGTYLENLPRVTIKHLTSSSHRALQQYCATSKELQQFWLKYLIASNNQTESYKFISMIDLSGKSNTLSNFSMSTQHLHSKVPETIQSFVCDPSDAKWHDRKYFGFASDSIASASVETRRAMVEILYRGIMNEDYQVIKIWSTCLGFAKKIASHSLVRDRRLASGLDIVINRGADHDSLYDMIDFIVLSQCLTPAKIDEHPRVSQLCLRLGLIDHALHISSLNITQLEGSAVSMVEHLHKLYINLFQMSLKNINPLLYTDSLSSMEKLLFKLADEGIAMNVITIVIYSTTLFLLKLDIHDKNAIAPELPKLETIFKFLKSYLENCTFHLSDKLVSATNNLTTAIKNNLDALSDSLIMREAFRKLIETVAGRCMIEGRYKSAAMLYSHIEDNVNAIKSLMRTGEADIVINYAFLVRDFTVNRITINYLKHLKVDTKIIDDFVSKSQL